MALVKCKECGKEVSNKASKCPNCGAKPPKKTSPVTWLVLIAIMFVVYVTSTSPDKDSPVVSSTSSAPPLPSASEKPKVPPVSKKPQWRTFDSTDEMSGERKAFAVSPHAVPTKRMEFPYSDVDAWIGVGCDKSSEWAYIGFSKAPNLNDTETKDGYNLINTRVKWGDSLVREILTQDWGAKYIHFQNYSTAIQKLAGSTGMMLELKWHSQGAVRFDFSLKGSSKAIAEMRSACQGF